MTDDQESWRRLVCNGLDESRRTAFNRGEFVECDACAAKPGTPVLCTGCLANRNTITWLWGK